MGDLQRCFSIIGKHAKDYLQGVDCPECERMQKMYAIFQANLSHLQFGDTFRITAALINNKQSVLPAELHDFKRYQPLLAACDEYSLRLPDTPEGINKNMNVNNSDCNGNAKPKKNARQMKNKPEKMQNGEKEKRAFSNFWGIVLIQPKSLFQQ